jgi:general secretion pathway protein B
MSSILKALKKLEDDKASRRPDDLKIDSDILKSDHSSFFSPTLVIIGSIVLLAGGSGATYMYMKHGAATSPPGYKVSSVPTRQNSPVVPKESAIKTERLPPAVVVVPAQVNIKEHIEPVKQRQATISPKPATTVAPPQPAKPVVVVKSALQAKEPLPKLAPVLNPPQSVPVKVTPLIRINGIAFQNNSADNMAIVNGVPVSNGATVEGVKVVEILSDRVRFSNKGEKFEVLLGQSNR